MAVPDRKTAAPKMLKLEHTIEDPLSNAHVESVATTEHSFFSGAQGSHLPSPATTSRPLHDEYSGRSSREIVLQRLSEALLRRSLTKVTITRLNIARCYFLFNGLSTSVFRLTSRNAV